MLTHKLEIYKSTRQLVSMMLCQTRNISRDVKFAEWSDARRLANEALDMVFVINSEKDANKASELAQKYLSLIFGIQNRIRLLSEAKYLSTGYKTQIILKVEECAKQGVGWRNYKAQQARVKEQYAN